MQRVSGFQNVYVLTDSNLDLALQDINKFLALMVITDPLVILPGLDCDQKRFEVLIFSAGRQGCVSIIFRSLGMGLYAAFQLGFRLFEQGARVNLQRSGNLQKGPHRGNGLAFSRIGQD